MATPTINVEPRAAPPKACAPIARRPSRVAFYSCLTSGVFVVVVALTMLVRYHRTEAEDPVGARELLQLREKLHVSPKDEALKKQIREVDLRERRRFFAHVQRNTWGAWLLLAGVATFVVSASRVLARSRFPTPRPLATPVVVEKEARLARASVATVAGTILVLLAVIGVTQRVRLEVKQAPAAAVATSAPSPVSAESLSHQWPRFRGADGSGFTEFTNFPST